MISIINLIWIVPLCVAAGVFLAAVCAAGGR